MVTLLDGKLLSKKVQNEIADKIEKLKVKHNKVPGLAVVLVGNDPASMAYVGRKEKMAGNIGMYSRQIQLPETTSQVELLEIINKLNNDKEIHAILVQLPLPKHINTDKVLMTIDPEKDVDGFHPVNMGKLLSGLEPAAIPCTPLGVIKLLEDYNIELKGKNAVVIGRSNIVGKPVSILLLSRHATVTICHSRTQNIDKICQNADIIVVAIGKEKYLKKEWVKPGAVIIDVGINRSEETGKLVGDVDFDGVKDLCSFITPVPKGVGPMTIAMLLSNTLKLFEKTL
ncbi:MAG: bifunctional methylenetetrahydrofolate dehydrogenase/methenyltetrahydrofolate cyclohydrolase FolD [Cyanobacteriota bacterium]